MHNRYSGSWIRGSVCAFLAVVGLQAEARSVAVPPDALGQMSSAIQTLTKKVSPAVVKILVTGYGPVEQQGRRNTGVVGRQHVIGSGVIVDPNGYIITNAHVIGGAQSVRVVLSPAGRGDGTASALTTTRTFKARIAGVDKTTDVAVLKIDAAGLPTIPIGDYQKLHQGQLVLAFGSPEGLDDTVTMGVVSSVMRQPDPDNPMIYIQTDAAINPGNSGGPLVDVEGNLAGINTFIFSQSGGSEGISFAIPSAIVRFVYEEILAHGHVHRRRIGATLQAITPALVEGLGLPKDSGLMVSDLVPDGPAETAGLRIQDIILAVDGAPVEGLPVFETTLYRKSHGDAVTLDVLRGARKLTLKIPVVEEQQNEFDDIADLVDPEKGLVQGLGILGVEVTPKITNLLPDLRIDSGVIVAAKAADAAVDTGLEVGDVIHAINGAVVESIDGLRTVLKRLKPGGAIAIQIEREGQLMYLATDLE